MPNMHDLNQVLELQTIGCEIVSGAIHDLVVNVDNSKFPTVISVEGHGHTLRPQWTGEEGGALNAGWRTVDALVNISNKLGSAGLHYNVDWYWEHVGSSVRQYESNDRWKDHESSYILSFKREKDAEQAKFWLEMNNGVNE